MRSDVVDQAASGGAAAPAARPRRGPSGLAVGPLAIGGAAFLLLTVGIFWYQFHLTPRGDAGLNWRSLRWEYLLLIVLSQQHYVVDVPAGAALGRAAFEVFRYLA